MAGAALDAALDRLARLHPKSIDLSLGRIARLLKALGEPQLALPPVLHVAGTNGKGSVIAFARAMAEAAGLKTHVYTSPHLVRFNERIVAAGAELDDEALVALLDRVERANDGAPITFFEITTAAAFLAFHETPADLCLLETGLGGRVDATNVVPVPAATAVTRIGLDHMEYLGSDLATIALEKAGVMKPNVPVVIGPQEPAARTALVAAALQTGAPARVWGVDFSARPEGDRLVFEAPDQVIDLPLPALFGDHQFENAAVAAASALALKTIPTSAIAAGVARARWPARLELIGPGPLFAAAHPDGEGELWIDGAHNPSGARALARALADLDDREPRPLVLVTAIQANKDVRAILTAFKGLARGVATTALASGAGVPPEDLASAARAVGLDAEAAPTLIDALASAREFCAQVEPAPRVVICGSLHLAGEALALDGGRTRRATTG